MFSTGWCTPLFLLLFVTRHHKAYSNPVLQDDLNDVCPCVLQSEDIWNCKNLGLTEVPKQCWALQPEVKQILLSHNDIQAIYSGDFDGISLSLSELMLDHNKINYVDQQAFNGLSSLEILDISHNDIIKLPETAMSDLKNLKMLIIVENSAELITKVRGLLELSLVTVYGIISGLIKPSQTNSISNSDDASLAPWWWTTNPWWETTVPWWWDYTTTPLRTDGTTEGPYVTTSTDQGPSCPQLFDQVGDVCLFVNLFSPGTWQESQYMCHALGSDLISIESAEDFETVLHYLKNNGLTNHDYWIGGNDTSSEGDWQWVSGNRVHDGSPFWAIKDDGYGNYLQEPQGSSAENCLCLDHLRFFFMDDQDCSGEKPAICGVQI